MLHRWVTLAGLSAFGLTACGAGGVYFAGKGQSPSVEPAQIASTDRAPAGQRRLGRLTVDCTPLAGADALDGARLSDVSCSQALLLAALRERAASEGGVFLVEPRCSGGLECHAELWGPSDVERFTAPALPPRPVNVDPLAPAAPGAPAFGAVADAWRVRIEVWPVAGGAPRRATAPEQVTEIDFPRAGQPALAELRASCDENCSESSARTGLRAAAAALGATSVVGVRCVAGAGAPSCVATAAAPGHPDTEPLAGAH